MANNSRSSKKLVLAGVIAAVAAAIGAGSMLPANAAPPPTTINATGPTQADAISMAFANCQQQGYNADRVDSTRTNPDGTVTVALYCYNV
jgi:hypothetical protein